MAPKGARCCGAAAIARSQGGRGVAAAEPAWCLLRRARAISCQLASCAGYAALWSSELVLLERRREGRRRSPRAPAERSARPVARSAAQREQPQQGALSSLTGCAAPCSRQQQPCTHQQQRPRLAGVLSLSLCAATPPPGSSHACSHHANTNNNEQTNRQGPEGAGAQGRQGGEEECAQKVCQDAQERHVPPPQDRQARAQPQVPAHQVGVVLCCCCCGS